MAVPLRPLRALCVLCFQKDFTPARRLPSAARRLPLATGYAAEVSCRRSAIFAAPQTYDSDISLTPEKAGEVSGRFEKWVYSTYGLRSDRVSIGLGDEHYCIEAPATSDGERKLVGLIQQWSSQPFPGIESVLTPWYPEGIGRKVAHLVPPSPEQQANYKAAVQKREADIAAMESAHRRAASDAKAALNQHAAEVARAAESRRQYELQRQTYREEYKRVTGRYPDE